MRAWVEPVNNLVFADVDGHIGYRARGHVPLRTDGQCLGAGAGLDGRARVAAA